MRRALAIVAILAWPCMALGQTAAAPDAAETARDRSYLTGLLEDNLSGEGVQVRLEGFEGALSSRATFDTLTIADQEGVWLTVRNGALAWERGALLSGRVQISELSAEAIELPRLPKAEGAAAAPEAAPFSLPDLPVSVEIGSVSAKSIQIGAPVLGQSLTASLSGSVTLAAGDGKLSVQVQRTDAIKGRISLAAGFANATRQLSLDLLFDEAANGVAAQLLGLPDAPALMLAVAGNGPLDAFSADIALSTDGQRRLGGTVSLGAVAQSAEDKGAARQFSAKLSGDVSPLFAAPYRPFFGDSVSVSVVGGRDSSGRTELADLSVITNALSISGKAAIAADGAPERAALVVEIALPDGQDVTLPIAGVQSTLRRGDLALEFDATTGDAWKLGGRLEGLKTETLSVVAGRLQGSGRVRFGEDGLGLGGTVSFALGGIDGAAGLAQAVGPFVTGRSLFDWSAGAPLRLSRLSLTGSGYALTGDARIGPPAEGLPVSGQLRPQIAQLAPFSALAGRELSGALAGEISGQAVLLSGAYSADFNVSAQDLNLSQPDLDRLLKGRSTLSGQLRRGEEGITLEALALQAPGLKLAGSGVMSTQQTQLSAEAELPSLSILERGFGGQLSARAEFAGRGQDGQISLDLSGRQLSAAQPELHNLLGGRLDLSLRAVLEKARLKLQSADLQTAQLSAQAEGVISETARHIDLNAQLANTAVLAPGFPGPATLSGRVEEVAEGYRVDLDAGGPGGTRARIRGQIAAGFERAALEISGSSEAALANAFIAPRSVNGPLEFDLRLDGPLTLASVSGQIGLSNAVLIAPNLGLALRDLGVNMRLAGGQAQLEAAGGLEAGGRVALSGSLGLSAPYSGDLQAIFDRARLRDPELYDTRVSGQIGLRGSLAGGARISGALTLSDTELQIPTSLGGIGDIPEITHLAEPAAVQDTRRKAGLLQEAQADGGSGGADFPLDILLSSEQAIFVRGRGLDAEMGGQLRISGSLRNVVPIGEFHLIRGRLDILGKRFVLDQGRIAVQGALVPWISFSATTEQTDYSTTIAIEGEATEPEIRFISSPELPEEEVLARLLFDRGLTNLSPLQAAQLAAAVATLAGKGGGGIINKLREGTGLDDLDISTDAEGTATLRAGKYISENIYTDLAVDSAGKTEINLNLDLTPNLTARGSVGSDGQTGLGVFYEKDY